MNDPSNQPSVFLEGTVIQPWESAEAFDKTVINVALCEIYYGKKTAVVRFSMSVVFIFTT